jgi:hypothetical protein
MSRFQLTVPRSPQKRDKEIFYQHLSIPESPLNFAYNLVSICVGFILTRDTFLVPMLSRLPQTSTLRVITIHSTESLPTWVAEAAALSSIEDILGQYLGGPWSRIIMTNRQRGFMAIGWIRPDSTWTLDRLLELLEPFRGFRLDQSLKGGDSILAASSGAENHEH